MKEFTKKEKLKLKKFWKQYIKIENDFYYKMGKLEDTISKEIGISDIEIFFCDGEAVGIGNASRTKSLVLRKELEK